MGGGLLQLVAYGAQDAYLSGNPQITFWKGLYKRHTNFAMEPFRINFTGQPNWGTKQSAVIGRHADLLYSTYLEVVMPPGDFNNDQYRGGYNLIRYAELEIGGQLIDRLYGEWLFLWDCLSSSFQQGLKLHNMVGFNDDDFTYTVPAPVQCNVGNGKPSLPTVLYVPLYFFFTKNPGAALPLIALQYHEVKINLLWNKQEFIKADFTVTSDLPGPVQAAIYIDYIYLDVEERRRMAQQSHEYLIEQTQFNEDKGVSSYSNRIDLTFNHPVKELVWVVQPSSYVNCSLAAQWAGDRLKPFTYDQPAVYEQHLQINGQDRLDKRYGDYFSRVQPYQHHTGSFNVVKSASDGLPDLDDEDVMIGNQNGAYMYSFALRPEEHQPSGTCNFSRIDTATIVMNLSGAIPVSDSYSSGQLVDVDASWNVRVYAVNYNILRIMSGMAGLAYSN
jgi:hypothetical protein